MKGNNLIVACVVSGVATSPFCAYRNHLSGLLSGGSFDEWFVVSVTSGDGFQAFRSALITCAVFGFIVGLLVKLVFGHVDPRKEFELNLLRTPIAPTVLFPVGIATILLIADNHTLKAFETFAWPESFYFHHLTFWTVVTATVGATLTGSLNVLNRLSKKPASRSGWRFYAVGQLPLLLGWCSWQEWSVWDCWSGLPLADAMDAPLREGGRACALPSLF